MILLRQKKNNLTKKYGLLYNDYAANDVRNLANTDWHVGTDIDFTALVTYLGDSDDQGGHISSPNGGKLKEVGLTRWDAPNVGATDELGFTAVGAGVRDRIAGEFFYLNYYNVYWISDPSATITFRLETISSVATLQRNLTSSNKKHGHSVRLMKDSTTLNHGETSIYTGNDGRVYNSICIGTQEWLAENLAETKYRNDDIISWFGANEVNYFTDGEWSLLSSEGCCAYDNILSNVANNFSFPALPPAPTTEIDIFNDSEDENTIIWSVQINATNIDGATFPILDGDSDTDGFTVLTGFQNYLVEVETTTGTGNINISGTDELPGQGVNNVDISTLGAGRHDFSLGSVQTTIGTFPVTVTVTD